jgi:16S rRNA processing protein RimM
MDLEVYEQKTGENIGFVVNFFTAGNDILEIQLHKQPELLPEPELKDLSQISRISKRKKVRIKKPKPVTVLIPFVREIVPVVDVKNKRIEINPPLGLLDLDSVEAVN